MFTGIHIPDNDTLLAVLFTPTGGSEIIRGADNSGTDFASCLAGLMDSGEARISAQPGAGLSSQVLEVRAGDASYSVVIEGPVTVTDNGSVEVHGELLVEDAEGYPAAVPVVIILTGPEFGEQQLTGIHGGGGESMSGMTALSGILTVDMGYPENSVQGDFIVTEAVTENSEHDQPTRDPDGVAPVTVQPILSFGQLNDIPTVMETEGEKAINVSSGDNPMAVNVPSGSEYQPGVSPTVNNQIADVRDFENSSITVQPDVSLDPRNNLHSTSVDAPTITELTDDNDASSQGGYIITRFPAQGLLTESFDNQQLSRFVIYLPADEASKIITNHTALGQHNVSNDPRGITTAPDTPLRIVVRISADGVPASLPGTVLLDANGYENEGLPLLTSDAGISLLHGESLHVRRIIRGNEAAPVSMSDTVPSAELLIDLFDGGVTSSAGIPADVNNGIQSEKLFLWNGEQIDVQAADSPAGPKELIFSPRMAQAGEPYVAVTLADGIFMRDTGVTVSSIVIPEMAVPVPPDGAQTVTDMPLNANGNSEQSITHSCAVDDPIIPELVTPQTGNSHVQSEELTQEHVAGCENPSHSAAVSQPAESYFPPAESDNNMTSSTRTSHTYSSTLHDSEAGPFPAAPEEGVIAEDIPSSHEIQAPAENGEGKPSEVSGPSNESGTGLTSAITEEPDISTVRYPGTPPESAPGIETRQAVPVETAEADRPVAQTTAPSGFTTFHESTAGTESELSGPDSAIGGGGNKPGTEPVVSMRASADKPAAGKIVATEWITDTGTTHSAYVTDGAGESPDVGTKPGVGMRGMKMSPETVAQNPEPVSHNPQPVIHNTETAAPNPGPGAHRPETISHNPENVLHRPESGGNETNGVDRGLHESRITFSRMTGPEQVNNPASTTEPVSENSMFQKSDIKGEGFSQPLTGIGLDQAGSAVTVPHKVATAFTGSPRSFVSEPVEQQIITGIVRQVTVMQRDGISSVVLRLEPPSLGKMKLDILTEHSKVTGRIVVESVEVKELIQHGLAELRNSLAQNGMQVESFDVQVGHNGGTDSWAAREHMKYVYDDLRRHPGFANVSDTGENAQCDDGVRVRARLLQSKLFDVWM